ncbi:MAG: P-loop NTPase fold protein [Rhodothermales bacterium]
MSQRPTIISDRYTDVDRLNVSDYVRALAEVVADPDSDTPLTIGVFGPWGSGKTSMMRMMQRALETGPVAEQFPNASDYAVVWFDAWKYEREDALWRALVLRVLHTIRHLPHVSETTFQKQFDDLERSLYRVVEREELGKLEIQWGEVARGAGRGSFISASTCSRGSARCCRNCSKKHRINSPATTWSSCSRAFGAPARPCTANTSSRSNNSRTNSSSSSARS